MEFIIIGLVFGIVPVLALLFAPRRAMKFIAPLATLPSLYLIYATWSFADTCQSDGCIGIFFLAAIAAAVGLATLVAGLVRWAMIAAKNRRENKELD